MVENTMKHAPRRYILTLCLLIPLALLAASCGGGSDSTTFQDSATRSEGKASSAEAAESQTNENLQSSDQNRVRTITAGEIHTCALRQTGTITCWGNNWAGQLGNSTQTDSSVPVEVLGITDAKAITAGASIVIGGHTCALRQTGTITCWGTNWDGQLGNGQSGRDANSSVPVTVLGITDATAITAGGDFTCALRLTRTITCWGNNRSGKLGNGRSGYYAGSTVPVEVLGINDATAITAGNDHACALRQTGTITCWGNNYNGQLGNGQSGRDANSSVPVTVLGITDATAITAGGGHTCALRQTGTITCWGDNYKGQLGNGTETVSSVPVEVLGITDATTITASIGYGSGLHTCALRQTGTIACWGLNRGGQLGNGQSGNHEYSFVPVEVLGINDATQITAGNTHTCALRRTGTITCWGNNWAGQLGNGTTDSSSVPVEVLGINDATAITAGEDHTCALQRTGAIACWGLNRGGQLGNGTTDSSSEPVEVLGINDATQITAGGTHSCALLQTGTITCWGNNWAGQLGNGTTDSSSVPVEVLGINDATAITAGEDHTCALQRTGAIACWGLNRGGQLGNGTTDSSSEPVEVLGINDATQITAGGTHSCALLQTGTITCWGDNRDGQLGNGQTTDSSSEPVEVLGINDATAITAGEDHTCALRQTDTITCWGNNEYGQLGNSAFLPQDVIGFGG